MGRAVLQLTFYGLLLALAASHPNKGDWDIYSFHINSTVTGRYATTIITSRVANRMEESKEIEFHVQIPKNAFISKFRILTVIKKDNEIDVSTDDMRIFIFIHERDGNTFLWPVLKQSPSTNNTEGIFSLQPGHYERGQHHTTRLKLNNKMIHTISSTAKDYSVSPPTELQCWFVSPDDALQRPLQDFFFTPSMLEEFINSQKNQ